MYVCMYVCTCIYIYIYACICVRACVYVHAYIITKCLVILKYITGAILCLPLDLPPKSKLYVILAICYDRKCVTVASILNINSIMFNIDMKTCCLACIYAARSRGPADREPISEDAEGTGARAPLTLV